MRARIAALVLFAMAGAPAEALADQRTQANRAIEPPAALEFRLERSRTRQQRVTIAALVAGSALTGAVGLLFHLDSRSAARTIDATGSHTGRVYDSEVDATRRRGLRSRNVAIGVYSVAGALAVAAVTALILTEPGVRPVEVGPPVVSVTPIAGGVSVGKAWRF